MVGKGKGANKMKIQADVMKLKGVLTDCRTYILRNQFTMEVRHDDPDDRLYMDFDVWERMKEAGLLINKIDECLKDIEI